jgi:lipoyl(octanoyl) transferase
MHQPLITCNLLQPGRVGYQTAWDIQRMAARARASGEIGDALILLEHPHTYTLGRSGDATHLLMSAAERVRLGVTAVEVDRGGDITYHGPGQLVAYPILYLGKPDPSGRLVRADYVGYVRKLEETLIRTVASFGIEAHREEGYTGVWVAAPGGSEKIAAIGVRVDARGVSTHGAALNVTTDMRYFAGIVPCGLADRPVTSMQMLMGDDVPSMPEVIRVFCAAFEQVFERRLVPNAALEKRLMANAETA